MASAGVASAQTTTPPKKAPVVELEYEREVFRYPVAGRRDPFSALSRRGDLGPRFDELTLHGIIFSERAGTSVAVLSDGSGKRHRVRRGDVVGDAQVLDIGQTRVVFSVESFGIRRQEVLELGGDRPGVAP
jgi:type II secretory pathway component PulC